ncbi:MAG TPA: hypothetical protein VNN74_08670 [Candidatus Micrarchaeia archaeon]|nr:hypothetical protein [Candidatus Micrarchaeia archaeon]
MTLPSPTSGPGVAAYLALILFTVAILYLVITSVGPHLHGDVSGLRHGLGLR